MAHHLLCWTASIANGADNVDVAAVTDGYASLQNGHYLMPRDGKLIAAAAVGATITRGRFVSPTMRTILLPQVQPVNVGANIVTPTPISNYDRSGFKINAVDELEFDARQDSAGAEREFGFAWIGDGNWNIPPGDVWTALATGAITGVVGSWVLGTLTLSQGLPKGLYSVVGMTCQGTNIIAARLNFPTGGNKPGCLAQSTISIVPNELFRFGRMGEWGQFVHTATPSLEIMVGGANTAQNVWLDLVKVG